MEAIKEFDPAGKVDLSELDALAGMMQQEQLQYLL